MSFKCGYILTKGKHCEQVAFVMKNKLPVGILERSLHTLIVNTTLGTRLGEYLSRTAVKRHLYHKSNEWTDNDFMDKKPHVVQAQSRNISLGLKNHNFTIENSQHDRYKHNKNNRWRSRNDDFNENSQDGWHRQNRNNRSRFTSYDYANETTEQNQYRESKKNRLRFENNDFDNRNQRRTRRMFESTTNMQDLEIPKWDLENLPPITKDCYMPHPDVTSREVSEVEAYREANRITVTGAVVPNPIQRFEETNFPNYILEKFTAGRFEKPTPIQAQAWPIVMSGHNLIGIAETGSGKTIGYIAPAIVHIKKQVHDHKQRGPTVVILAPTRELAQQIQSVAAYFGDTLNIKSACLFGGASPYHQVASLAMNPKICVATPGRLIDFVSNKQINLKQCTYLVIDEADRMLDMGFEPQIRQIIQQIRPDRQIVMWSASWPKTIGALARNYIQNPVHITIGSPDGGANRDITQVVDLCTQTEKMERLERLLATIYEKDENGAKILIFVSTKRRADIVGSQIYNAGYPVLSIHGNKSQAARNKIVNEFRNTRSHILVATDVVARGLDVPDIDYVINLDYPNTTEQYIHRIGRTARSGRKGNSHTFFTRQDVSLAPDLINVLEEANQEVNPQLIKLARNPGWH